MLPVELSPTGLKVFIYSLVVHPLLSFDLRVLLNGDRKVRAAVVLGLMMYLGLGLLWAP